MKNSYLSLLLFSIFTTALITACNTEAQQQDTEVNVEEQALALSKKYIIVDGHIDLPYRMKIANFRLEREFVDPSVETEGDFDYVKAKEGGLDAPFMSIYIPASYQAGFDHEYGNLLEGEKNRAKALADSLITLVEEITEKYPDKFAIATSPEEVESHFEKGLIALPMGMENGAPIGDDLANVKYFYDRGIRYITLTHSKVNQICDSSYDSVRVWNGLSPFGEEVVQEMNKVGIMVDVSHISDSTFYDVMKLSKAPVIASHSSCREFVPGFERNMNDDMLLALAENGGVIQINFGSTFVDDNSREKSEEIRAHIGQWLEENKLSYQDSAAQAYIEEYMKANPAYSTVKKVADHVDHVVQLVGVDYVGFGSDFDGVGDTLPTGLKDASDYPNLIAELLQRGYSEEDIEKICYKNVFRVWQEVQNVAEELS
ncbi:dipeptidase [Catalinimonas niigatensis]|uniref:dipeptidase n=1 Tax=Catalinimonas niigatensis TaxID=1397264 RepID=UPI002666C9B4|nr:dipeptidase [Catalinimonas niigatensis]WPP49610.1 dipeptidase [Catalinimonas niigatensis]